MANKKNPVASYGVFLQKKRIVSIPSDPSIDVIPTYWMSVARYTL